MNYNDNGNIKQITVKAGDTLPVGTIVEFDGTTIPAGYEQVEEEKDIYSSEEVKTNKVWIDGKPIYRRVLYFSATGTHTETFRLYSEVIQNLSMIVNMYGIYSDAGLSSINSVINAPAVSGVSYGCTSNIDIGNKRVFLDFGGSSSDVNARLIVEYTKTTD